MTKLNLLTLHFHSGFHEYLEAEAAPRRKRCAIPARS